MTYFEANKLHKRFGSRIVLEDISLAFEKGAISGIMGPNGAGKTTCFNVLTGRYAPDRGQIFFNGTDITGHKPQTIARLGISRSFQLMNLFDESVVIENVMVALPLFRDRQWHSFHAPFRDRDILDEAFGILDEVGLEAHAWTRSSALSYGQRRALEIGVALAARPKILFLDEPTSGLGAEGTQKLAQLIDKLRDHYTIVMIEHDMQFLFGLADRINVIHWGQVIAEGTPTELQQDKWVQRSALGELA
jgi:branched-chain amino acid transport system ATP-binding protein